MDPLQDPAGVGAPSGVSSSWGFKDHPIFRSGTNFPDLDSSTLRAFCGSALPISIPAAWTTSSNSCVRVGPLAAMCASHAARMRGFAGSRERSCVAGVPLGASSTTGDTDSVALHSQRVRVNDSLVYCSFVQRFAAASLAIAARRSGDRAAFRAAPPFIPPLRPSSTAASLLVGGAGVTSASPVASSTMRFASWLRSRFFGLVIPAH